MSVGTLTPTATGFTFTATGVAFPPGKEAALLGDMTYLNVFTSAFPDNGEIRGQVVRQTQTSLPTGTATATGAIANIENVTGSGGDDTVTGGEVKVTRASRDGGVDAVAFDPDPIRGGKIVIQAKRYTNVVGVSAVRDLYGTVMNEGATKGILVTTADYGQDSYEFAKDKPLTLLSGSELLYLLQKHGHRARIDLAEAKKLALERDRAHGATAV